MNKSSHSLYDGRKVSHAIACLVTQHTSTHDNSLNESRDPLLQELILHFICRESICQESFLNIISVTPNIKSSLFFLWTKKSKHSIANTV